LNSNNGIEFIFSLNLFVLLQISEGLNYLNLIQTNGLKKVKVHCALGLSPQRCSACSSKVAQPTWGLLAQCRGSRWLAGRFRPPDSGLPGKIGSASLSEPRESYRAVGQGGGSPEVVS
jgi:hypothetical protein